MRVQYRKHAQHACQVGASSDLLVAGAYPRGQNGDILRNAPTAASRAAIAWLARPAADPMFGKDGPMLEHWSDGFSTRLSPRGSTAVQSGLLSRSDSVKDQPPGWSVRQTARTKNKIKPVS